MAVVKNPKRTNLKLTPASFEPADGCYPEVVEPGSAELKYSGTVLMLACPGCGRLSGMTVGDPKPPNGNGATWRMTGTWPEITLEPSINCVSCCGWHGWLRGGMLVSC